MKNLALKINGTCGAVRCTGATSLQLRSTRCAKQFKLFRYLGTAKERVAHAVASLLSAFHLITSEIRTRKVAGV